jgi:NADPH:quinone reductase-like Zn-dependent oxidoreductase
VPEKALATMPAKLLFEEAAACPVAALTAWQALFETAGLAQGSTLVVLGAAGGVGHFAVQLAARAGARVVGTASGGKHPFVLSLGAQAAIDYTSEELAPAVARHFPGGADVVLDTVGGITLTRAVDAVKPGGRLVSIVDEPDREAAAGRGVVASAVMSRPDGERLGAIGRMFDERKLKPHVQKIFPLASAADAHRLIEGRHVQGKLVLNI